MKSPLERARRLSSLGDGSSPFWHQFWLLSYLVPLSAERLAIHFLSFGLARRLVSLRLAVTVVVILMSCQSALCGGSCCKSTVICLKGKELLIWTDREDIAGRWVSTCLDAGVLWAMLHVSSWVKGPSQIKFSNLEDVVRLPSHGIFTPIIYPNLRARSKSQLSIECRFEKMKTSLSQNEFRFWTGHSWLWWADHLSWLVTRVPHWWVWSFTRRLWGGLVPWLGGNICKSGFGLAWEVVSYFWSDSGLKIL